MPRRSSARAQSSVSAIEGGFLRPSLRTAPTNRAASVGEALVQSRHFELHDAAFLLGAGKIDEQMQASPAQRLRQFAHAIRRQHDDRQFNRAQRSQLRHRHLEIGKHLEQKSLELLVGFIDLSMSSTTLRGEEIAFSSRPLQQYSRENRCSEISSHRIP